MIRGFILPMSKLLTLFPRRKLASGWKMTPQYLECYAADPEIQAFEFQTKTTKWWGQRKGRRGYSLSSGKRDSPE